MAAADTEGDTNITHGRNNSGSIGSSLMFDDTNEDAAAPANAAATRAPTIATNFITPTTIIDTPLATSTRVIHESVATGAVTAAVEAVAVAIAGPSLATVNLVTESPAASPGTAFVASAPATGGIVVTAIDTGTTAIPEPGSLALLGLGIVALGMSRRRRG